MKVAQKIMSINGSCITLSLDDDELLRCKPRISRERDENGMVTVFPQSSTSACELLAQTKSMFLKQMIPIEKSVTKIHIHFG